MTVCLKLSTSVCTDVDVGCMNIMIYSQITNSVLVICARRFLHIIFEYYALLISEVDDHGVTRSNIYYIVYSKIVTTFITIIESEAMKYTLSSRTTLTRK